MAEKVKKSKQITLKTLICLCTHDWPTIIRQYRVDSLPSIIVHTLVMVAKYLGPKYLNFSLVHRQCRGVRGFYPLSPAGHTHSVRRWRQKSGCVWTVVVMVVSQFNGTSTPKGSYPLLRKNDPSADTRAGTYIVWIWIIPSRERPFIWPIVVYCSSRE